MCGAVVPGGHVRSLVGVMTGAMVNGMSVHRCAIIAR
jgi:hypothetical protein